jgi:carbamoylphosphate synthase large subunit
MNGVRDKESNNECETRAVVNGDEGKYDNARAVYLLTRHILRTSEITFLRTIRMYAGGNNINFLTCFAREGS